MIPVLFRADAGTAGLTVLGSGFLFLCMLWSMWMWAGLLVGFAQACLEHVALGDERPSGLVLVEAGTWM